MAFSPKSRGYTSKQWGRQPEDIDPAIIKRLPIRNNYDINYFNDYWQGIPDEGYNVLFERLLDHSNITIEYEMTLCMEGNELWARRNPDSAKTIFEINCMKIENSPIVIYYSGPIDALFNFRHGHLP